MKLTTKILFIALVPILIVMGAVSFVLVSSVKSNMLESLEKTLGANTRLLSLRIDENERELANIVNAIARDRDIPRALDRHDSRGVNQILNDQVAVYPFVNYILVLENDLTISASSTRNANGKKINSEGLLMKKANLSLRFPENINAGVGSVGADVFLDEVGIEQGLSQFYVGPVMKRGENVGWVLMSVSWGKIYADILDETLSDLIEADVPIQGIYLYSDLGQELISKTINDGNLALDRLSSIDKFSLGEAWGTIEVHYDKQRAMSAIHKTVKYVAIALLVGGLVLFFVLYFALDKIVISRFSVLQNSVRKIGRDGSFDKKISLEGQDEFSDLADSVNKMIDGIFEKSISIDYLNESIEKQDQLIVEREQKEKELLDARKYIDGITENAPQLLSYVDKHQCYRFVNRSYERWFDVSAEKFVGSHIKDGLGEDAYQAVLPYVRRALAGEVVNYSSVIPYVGGGERHINATYSPDYNDEGEVDGFFVSVEDVSSSKQAEVDLRDALQALDEQKFALDQHAIVAVTDTKGTITYVNDLFCSISGYRRDELLGNNHRLLNSGHHTRVFFTGLYKTISRGKVWHGEICNRAKDGSLYWVDTTIVPFMNEQGKPRSYIAIRTDITEVKRVQKLMEDARRSAEEAVRVKSDFLASMSHEIRTPMNGVLGMLGILEKSELTSAQKRQLQLAQASAKSLLVIINDILDFSKIESGKLELEILEFDIRDMVDVFAEGIAIKAAEKNIELVVDSVSLTHPCIKGDAGRIRQVLMNLVGNAIKFTDQGEILISSSLRQDSNGGLFFECAVKDTGIGIAEEKLENLFESFTQADSSTTRKYGGTGLGLSISKQLSQLMGGDIHVTSQEGVGSTFSFYVPVERSERNDHVLPNTSMENKRVLIVDANATVRSALKNQFSEWGLSVVEATSSNDAFAVLNDATSHKAPKNGFDLIVVDSRVDGVGGISFGENVRKNIEWSNIKLALMVSMGQMENTAAAIQAGFQVCLPKPMVTEDYFKTLSILAMERGSPENTNGALRHENDNGIDEYSALTPHELLNARILLAEDNPVNQEVASYILEDFGCDFDIVGNGKEALEILHTVGVESPYDLVLMDCQMPEMDGYEATMAIRKGEGGDLNRNIIVIAMTANAMAGDKERCLQVGMNDYLSKPIDEKKLYDVIHGWLEIGWEKGMQPEREIEAEMPEPSNARQDVVWDREAALRRCGNKEHRLLKLLGSFVSAAQEELKALEEVVQSEDAEKIVFTAHRLKGVVANLGGDNVAAILKDIENQVGVDPAYEHLAPLFSVLHEEFAKFTGVLTDFIAERDV